MRPAIDVAPRTDAGGARRQVALLAGLLILAQLAFRAWALYPSWFYLDDYKLLLEARTGGLEQVLDPFNGHLMPAGRLIVLAVGGAGSLDWALAATSTLVLQLLASVCAAWMLITLFGWRRAVLAPLAVYLFSVLTLPALMWWAACLTQLGIQLGLFVAVTAWVRHLRGDGNRWFAVTLAGLVVALLFDVKGLLIVPVLAYLALAYFASGGPVRRVATVLREHWRAVLVAALASGAYVGYYLAHVDQPLQSVSAGLVVGVASTMLGTAFSSAAVGGPWSWVSTAPPNAFADPPGLLVNLSWVVAAVIVGYSLLRRRRALRAWVLLALYLLVLLGLLVTSRGLAYGSVIGLEYRYLTDAAAVLALCLALAFLPLRGATETVSRREDLLHLTVPRSALVAVTGVVVVSSLFSSVRYVDVWHTRNASDAYVHQLRTSLDQAGAVELADTAVPEDVVPQDFAPDNSVRLLVPLLSDRVTYPRVSAQLMAVSAAGTLVPALVAAATKGREGPVDDCGWPVTASGRSIPLEGRAFDYDWWIQIGYLASAASPVTVTTGDTVVRTEVDAGLHNLYVRVSAGFDAVRVDGLDEDVTMCVDTLNVGQIVPGGAQ